MSLKETSRSSGQLLWWLPVSLPGDSWFSVVVVVFLIFPSSFFPSFSSPHPHSYVFHLPFFLWAYEWPLGEKVAGWASKTLLLRRAAMASPASYWQGRISLPTGHATAEPKCQWARSDLGIGALKCRHGHTHIEQTGSLAKSQTKLNYCELIINLSYYSHHLILSLSV